jgi:hypothetical protein
MNTSMKTKMLRNLKYGITNLIRWFPVIWEDRDWDYRYLLAILRFKLSNMRFAAENYWITASADEDAKDMGIAIGLIDRIANEYQENLAFKKHRDKWGNPEYRSKPHECNPKFNELIIEYPNVKTEKDEQRRREDLRRLMLQAQKAHKGYIDYLMRILSKIEGWWD